MMKNLNEPHRNLNEPERKVDEPQKLESEVIPFERRASTEKERSGGPLIPSRQMEDLRSRWTNVQSSFVDEPRKAVQEADQLVQMTIQQIEEGFKGARAELEKQWSKGDQVSTEDLRVCLQRYRSFFDRLLSKI
jgi:hypothetical protein